ncbi:uncharacterized protein B0H18DRAFT_360408 [Fomitopsis serialis]|uniref:uncharacterized protein n=1 Tax=Fomitopsis serialis TaxID=139415 RepID=UPI0020072621|nr:uncharacterized protein B0H18DRAFT_360408 [Neoantrodia serialis]KAH9926023.1 hypothetical protein B0H18DRAFT_360408 [Neoantrodia serialis]
MHAQGSARQAPSDLGRKVSTHPQRIERRMNVAGAGRLGPLGARCAEDEHGMQEEEGSTEQRRNADDGRLEDSSTRTAIESCWQADDEAALTWLSTLRRVAGTDSTVSTERSLPVSAPRLTNYNACAMSCSLSHAARPAACWDTPNGLQVLRQIVRRNAAQTASASLINVNIEVQDDVMSTSSLIVCTELAPQARSIERPTRRPGPPALHSWEHMCSCGHVMLVRVWGVAEGLPAPSERAGLLRRAIEPCEAPLRPDKASPRRAQHRLCVWELPNERGSGQSALLLTRVANRS